MPKMSQLAAELDELRHCGEVLIGISDTLREMFSGGDDMTVTQETPAEKPKGKAKAEKTAPAKEPEPEKPAEPEKKLTLADVRAVLAEKSRAGFTEEVKALIAKHGADRLLLGSDMPWQRPAWSKSLLDSLDISDEDRAKIEYRNACGLLGL